MTVFHVVEAEGPIIVTAIHAGHELRRELAASMRLSEEDRRREEDPFTEQIARIGVTEVVVRRSRFEVDMNRPRESCVYQSPEDAWGLDVWGEAGISADALARSLSEYDAFYAAMRELLSRKIETYGGFVVLDVHSYNHRRGGPHDPGDDWDASPDVNLGTGTLDRVRWGLVAESLLAGMTAAGFDARENVRFRGGAFSGWVHREFPTSGCALALEFKKTFMDEWTGTADQSEVERRRATLRGLLPSLRDALSQVLGRTSP